MVASMGKKRRDGHDPGDSSQQGRLGLCGIVPRAVASAGESGGVCPISTSVRQTTRLLRPVPFFECRRRVEGQLSELSFRRGVTKSIGK
jgi:hypothetical protein